uniref:EC49 protein n=1 Tax=Colletotrichum higginsianum TaxID=80884 RepID=I2G7C8_9PEZI|nr:EC49 protein [Colletotrichum higginsianum]
MQYRHIATAALLQLIATCAQAGRRHKLLLQKLLGGGPGPDPAMVRILVPPLRDDGTVE